MLKLLKTHLKNCKINKKVAQKNAFHNIIELEIREDFYVLKRKIEQVLMNWKNTKNHNPLIIKGCRQCGKNFFCS